MSMKTVIQNFAKDLKKTMHTTESLFDLITAYLPKFEENATLKYDKLADITTTGKSWTPDDKYSYYLIVVNLAGYCLTSVLPKDKVGSPVIISAYLNSEYNAGLNISTSTSDLKYTLAKVGFGNIQGVEIRGIY